MRRLLVSVAFLAALLIAPSAALATRTLRPTSPAPGARATITPVVTLDAMSLLASVTYNVFRADAVCATRPGVPCEPCRNGLPWIGSFTDDHGDGRGQLLLFRASR